MNKIINNFLSFFKPKKQIIKTPIKNKNKPEQIKQLINSLSLQKQKELYNLIENEKQLILLKLRYNPVQIEHDDLITFCFNNELELSFFISYLKNVIDTDLNSMYRL